MAEFKPYICLQTDSTCYNNTMQMKPVGILWHSTGANNPYIKRYVQPTDNSANYNKDIKKIGKNIYKNDWNHIYMDAGVNAFIGKFDDDTIGTVQTLPWTYAPWGSGSGPHGSLNHSVVNQKVVGWIQFEICEDNLTDKKYAEAVYQEALNLTAYLCKMYNIDPKGYVTVNGVKVPTITCHNDAYKLGLGSGHADINHWFPVILKKDMSNVRTEVAKMVKGKITATTATTETTPIVSVLKKGDAGSKVKTLQTNLNKVINAKLVVDSDFGIKTEEAVKQFQKKYKLTIDGIYGPASEEAMTKALKEINTKSKTTTTTNKQESKVYKIKVTADALNVRKGAGTNYGISTVIKKGEVYTIVEENNGWGLLKSKVGWIMLKYTSKV